MIRKWIGILFTIAIAAALLNVSSCARSQQLVSITLSPAGGFVFQGYGATGQFTAYGNYVHPLETKDISSQVVWTLNIQNFATISSSGLITYTRTDGCGLGEVTSTFNNSDGSVVTATAPVSGVNNGTTNCQ